MKSHVHTALLSTLCILLLAAAPQAQPSQQVADAAREYRIKSAFLYHFLHYGAWSRDAAAGESELVVCVAGDLPLSAAQETLSSKVLENRHVVVRGLDESESTSECRIAFFGASVNPVSEDLLLRLRDEGVLTVGETPAFTNRGGMIRLFKHRNRIRFEIKLETVRSAGIHMSSRVLALATIV